MTSTPRALSTDRRRPNSVRVGAASLLLAVGALLAPAPAALAESPATPPATPPATIQVYKTPTCGCCTKWVDHLRAAGFTVETTELTNAKLDALKAMNGVPAELASCHTGLVDGYVIEGHVPASDVRKLLAERPKVSGLAVPGMPMGSPGMEHPDKSRHEAFDVLAFGEGSTRVFSNHQP